MSKRFTDTEIWQKEWFLRLSMKHKMLIRFLFDNCDCAGIYEPNFMLLSFYIGETITEEDFTNLKQVRRLENGNYLIEDFLKFQYGILDYNSLNPKFSVHKGIIKSLEKNKLLTNSLIRVEQPLQDMDKDMDMDKDNIHTLIENKEKEEKEEKEKEEKEKEKEEKEERKKEERKLDPYTEIKPKLQNMANEVFGKCLITNKDCLRAAELSAEFKDFFEHLPECLIKAKGLQFPDYNPGLSWVLKDNNYADLINGVYDKKPVDVGKTSVAELRRQGMSEEQILTELRAKYG